MSRPLPHPEKKIYIVYKTGNDTRTKVLVSPGYIRRFVDLAKNSALNAVSSSARVAAGKAPTLVSRLAVYLTLWDIGMGYQSYDSLKMSLAANPAFGEFLLVGESLRLGFWNIFRQLTMETYFKKPKLCINSQTPQPLHHHPKKFPSRSPPPPATELTTYGTSLSPARRQLIQVQPAYRVDPSEIWR